MQVLPKKYNTSSNLSAILFGSFIYCDNNTIQYNTIQYNTIQYNTIQYNKFPQSLFLFPCIAQQFLSFLMRAIVPCSGIIKHYFGVVALFIRIVSLYTLFVPMHSSINKLCSFFTRLSNGMINQSRLFSQLYSCSIPQCKAVTKLCAKTGFSSTVSPQTPIINIYKSNFKKL